MSSKRSKSPIYSKKKGVCCRFLLVENSGSRPRSRHPVALR